VTLACRGNGAAHGPLYAPRGGQGSTIVCPYLRRTEQDGKREMEGALNLKKAVRKGGGLHQKMVKFDRYWKRHCRVMRKGELKQCQMQFRAEFEVRVCYWKKQGKRQEDNFDLADDGHLF